MFVALLESKFSTSLFARDELRFKLELALYRNWLAQFNYILIGKRPCNHGYWVGHAANINNRYFNPLIVGESLTAYEVGQLMGGN